MKNSKKALLIGLGATAAIAAIAAALAYEEEAVDKIGSYLNRQRMKNFVQPGDTLFRISNRFYGNATAWRKIREANKATISPDGRLRVGQVINLP